MECRHRQAQNKRRTPTNEDPPQWNAIPDKSEHHVSFIPIKLAVNSLKDYVKKIQPCELNLNNQIQRLTALLEQAMALGAQQQAFSNQPSHGQLPPERPPAGPTPEQPPVRPRESGDGGEPSIHEDKAPPGEIFPKSKIMTT